MNTAIESSPVQIGLNGTPHVVSRPVHAYVQLRALRVLPENWDGYGADSPRAEAVDSAQAFLNALAKFHVGCRMLPATLVAPTRTGGVLLEWESGPHQLEAEIENPERVTVAYLNTDSDSGESFVMRGGIPETNRFFELAALVFPPTVAVKE